MPAYSERRTRATLPNPFRTYSNFVYPRTIRDVLVWASYLWERNARYRTSVNKVVSYFISDITVLQDSKKEAVDTEAVTAFRDLLTKQYDLMSLVLQFGTELAAMGNVFVSAERIFSRELLCPMDDCGWQMHLKSLRRGRDYEWDGKCFTGVCPKCGRRVKWRIKDVKSEDSEGRRMRFVFRSAEDMQIQYNRLTGTFKYLYKIPEDVVSGICRGDAVYLEDSPQVFMEAATTGQRFIEFPADMFMSARTVTLSGMDRLYKGWGLPLFMVAFDNIIRMQHLDKFNEAVILDYLVPTRILSPAPQNLRAGIDDPNRMPMSGNAWRNMMQTAVKGRITNPTQWIISPVPVQQEQIGGDKSIIPTDLLEYETSQMLSDMGIPQEFRQTNFQVVAPTMGLRMFERQWVHFAKGLGSFVRWAAGVLSRAYHYENMTATLDTTSFVENDANRQIQLSLMQGGMIAKTPVLKQFGVDYEEDVKQQIREQEVQGRMAAEQQADQQNSEMVQSVLPPTGSIGINQAQAAIQQAQSGGEGAPQQPGAPAGPGAPQGGGGGGLPFNAGASQSASIEQQFQEAQQMAQELYAAPPNVRRQQLVNLKATNPTMHAMVKQFMTDMAQQTASQAVAQSRQG